MCLVELLLFAEIRVEVTPRRKAVNMIAKLRTGAQLIVVPKLLGIDIFLSMLATVKIRIPKSGSLSLLKISGLRRCW